MRTTDMPSRAASSSHGRSGDTKMWPRLRDQISSMKVTAKPRWLRNAVSHSSTPPSSMPIVTAPWSPSRAAKKREVKPQITICSTGQ